MKRIKRTKERKNFAIQVRMTEEMYDKVEAQAKVEKCSTAETIRKILKDQTWKN